MSIRSVHENGAMVFRLLGAGLPSGTCVKSYIYDDVGEGENILTGALTSKLTCMCVLFVAVPCQLEVDYLTDRKHKTTNTAKLIEFGVINGTCNLVH